jgi:hypothetical protein
VRLSKLFWPMLKDAQGHVVNIIGGAARTRSLQPVHLPPRTPRYRSASTSNANAGVAWRRLG